MSERRVPVFTLRNRGDLLPPGEAHQVRRTLNHGGLCVLPSDTCYAVAGFPLRRGVTELIDLILARRGEKIALSFASQVMAERYVELGTKEYRLLDAADHKTPLTVVAPVSQDLAPTVRDSLPRALFSEGEMGVRLPHSWVERQISAEMDAPITTAAIYYDDRTPVKNFSDALAVVLAGLSRLDKAETPLVGIRHPTIKAKDVSSVAGFPLNEEGRKMLMVYREGAVEHKRIVDIAGRLTPRDVEEWT